jgi:hypothetical protein
MAVSYQINVDLLLPVKVVEYSCIVNYDVQCREGFNGLLKSLCNKDRFTK